MLTFENVTAITLSAPSDLIPGYEIHTYDDNTPLSQIRDDLLSIPYVEYPHLAFAPPYLSLHPPWHTSHHVRVSSVSSAFLPLTSPRP